MLREGYMYNYTLNSTATFDLQNFKATVEDEKLKVSADFIIKSHARGCFLVIEGNASSPDIFQAIEREDSEQDVEESVDVPPSMYTVYAYDIEETALPHPIPANAPPKDIINITTGNTYSSEGLLTFKIILCR